MLWMVKFQYYSSISDKDMTNQMTLQPVEFSMRSSDPRLGEAGGGRGEVNRGDQKNLSSKKLNETSA